MTFTKTANGRYEFKGIDNLKFIKELGRHEEN